MLVGWPDHFSRADQMRAASVGLWPDGIEGPATGWIMGEQPGANTDPGAPLFPHPPGCAGHRLWEMSGIPLGTYLGRLRRENLLDTLRPWTAREARREALAWMEEWRLMEKPTRVVLCGARVARAFGIAAYFQLTEHANVRVVAIPHPSGKNLIYNAVAPRVAARAALAWAAATLLDEVTP